MPIYLGQLRRLGFIEYSRMDHITEGPLLDLLVKTGLGASKGAVKRLVAQGGVYVNNVRVTDEAKSLGLSDLGTETMVVLRSGKKSYHIVKVS